MDWGPVAQLVERRTLNPDVAVRFRLALHKTKETLWIQNTEN